MALSNIITEVVEIPLAVSFAEFLRTFQLDLLPILLKEEGVISVRTGMLTRHPVKSLNDIFQNISGTKIKTSENTSHAWAVSLTEWDSLESHSQFVQKATSAPFFETLKQLCRGPPNIDHYSFGSLRDLENSAYSRLVFSINGRLVSETIVGAEVICAESLDKRGKFCVLASVKEGTTSTATPSEHDRAFDVQWYSCERKILEPNL